MEHEYWEERVQGFVDNELSPADHNAVESHVAQCRECAANVAYFRAMKKRLALHASAVDMPDAVRNRLERLFERKRRGYKRWLWPAFGSAAALAAALLVFVLTPQPSRLFVPGGLTGKITCYDCEVAVQAGLTMGELCKDGHKMGMVTADGTLWRFAADDKGLRFIHHLEFLGKAAEVMGELQTESHMLRIHELHVLDQRQAGL